MRASLAPLLVGILAASPGSAQDVAVRGDVVHTMAGPALEDGVVLIRGGRIAAVGAAGDVEVPEGVTLLEAKVVVPGLVDAHSSVGLAGWLNFEHDSDELERSAPIQPELRATDAYNPREPLIGWIRGFGVTTVHTGHAPGALVSGQTLIAKTRGETVDEAVFVPFAMVAATLGEGALRRERKSPGTRSKAVAMLRSELLKARAYQAKREVGEEDEDGDEDEADGAPDLRMEALAAVLSGEVPLLVTAHRARDIGTALRLADEFGLRLVLDGAAEAYLVIEQIRAAGVPVLVHPTMQRAGRETENLSMETPARLLQAGIPVALQSGYESYVPRTRVLLFEAALAAANGLSFEEALSMATIRPARILGIDDRVGSIEVGKDGDLALFDGDPFEYTSHCTGVVIEGEVVSDEPR